MHTSKLKSSSFAQSRFELDQSKLLRVMDCTTLWVSVDAYSRIKYNFLDSTPRPAIDIIVGARG